MSYSTRKTNRRLVRLRPEDDGSIAIVVLVIMVASALVLTMLLVAERGMWASRRSGDSANALQVADAGVNAAIQFIPTVPASTMSIGPITGGVGEGEFTYTATKVNDQLWNVSSTGRDSSGMLRRVVAQAVAEPLFGRPIYVRAAATLKAGNTLDSYSDHVNRCTGQGVLTVDSPGELTFTGVGTGNSNCTRDIAADSSKWEWSIDGCDIPGDEADLTDPIPTTNDDGDKIIDKARCPVEPKDLPAGISGPAYGTKRVAPKLNPQSVVEPKAANVHFPSSGSIPGTEYTCGSSTATHFQSGKTYYYDKIIMLDGCRVTNAPASLGPTTKPTALYANTFEIGQKTGSKHVVNPPQTPSCPTNWDAGNITTGYCSYWVAHLQLNGIGAAKVTFKNSINYFWGVINAPQGLVTIEGGGFHAWGASVSNSFVQDNGSPQFSWHFDENLRNVIGSGRFGVDNWREEGTAT